MQLPKSWLPLSVAEIQLHLGEFRDWVLCGGCSLDLFLGTQTRAHGDLDIGVFRSQLPTCLTQIPVGQVHLCDPPGSVSPWNGKSVNHGVHDIWISDSQQENWILQVMVFDDIGETVTYRRDTRITWPKSSHSMLVGNVAILNPWITFLYKSNRPNLDEKDTIDIANLIRLSSNRTRTS